MGEAIAVTKGTNGELFQFQFLTTQGIDLSGVDLVGVKPLVKVSTNTKLPRIGYHFENLLWWANLDSNQGPQSYQDKHNCFRRYHIGLLSKLVTQYRLPDRVRSFLTVQWPSVCPLQYCCSRNGP